ncbi:MAG: transposon-encoded TnpW family protein [Eubacterium sp.]|nr:transposon-encoded TnpW family protein [Eubacterium sp.]
MINNSQIVKKIGNTTYTINLHFSETSKQNMSDKIIRLIKNSSENE